MNFLNWTPEDIKAVGAMVIITLMFAGGLIGWSKFIQDLIKKTITDKLNDLKLSNDKLNNEIIDTREKIQLELSRNAEKTSSLLTAVQIIINEKIDKDK